MFNSTKRELNGHAGIHGFAFPTGITSSGSDPQWHWRTKPGKAIGLTCTYFGNNLQTAVGTFVPGIGRKDLPDIESSAELWERVRMSMTGMMHQGDLESSYIEVALHEMLRRANRQVVLLPTRKVVELWVSFSKYGGPCEYTAKAEIAVDRLLPFMSFDSTAIDWTSVEPLKVAA